VELISMRIAFATAVILSATIPISRDLQAAEPAWPASSAYDYVVVDQDLRTVIEQFGLNTGLRVTLSDAVQGRVHGRLPAAPPREFFDHLTEMFGLDWYYDGATIAVSAKSEAQTQLIALKSADPRYHLRSGPDDNVAIASGPPQYLAMVKQVAATLSPAQLSKQSPPETHNVMVFRGSSASRVEFP
jgi:type III secretion protein C